ncbi:MAG: hypothetical protein MUF49_22370 [Oculatellaceae cyanobacterium Prado106]|jgi:Ca2+-binding RTX toxin-like protein|nr:hypothetical protein [Oculatellaceae cyanobacterium Prado106]
MDEIYGQNGDDWVHGGEGNDAIFGADGKDVLLGNEGSDEISGGADQDIIYEDNNLLPFTCIRLSFLQYLNHAETNIYPNRFVIRILRC